MMMMVIDGLADAERRDLAAQLDDPFCRTVKTHGLAENHDPILGKTHFDPA
jgi:hypothetical protein